MRKMSKDDQLQANGGKYYHYGYCVKCDKVFSTTKFWVSYATVRQQAVDHCYAYGGPSKGHRYIMLY